MSSADRKDLVQPREQVAHLDVLLHLHRLKPREKHGRRQFRG